MLGPHEVVPLRARQTHDLRRRVLRDGKADAVVEFEGDDAPRSFHLGLVAGEGRELVGVASFLDVPFQGRPAFQLRGMAVDPSCQGRGFGARLLEAGVASARARGAEVVWAKGRDAVLGFYQRQGWQVVGDGFVYGPMDLPHHLVVREL
jgi:predicted N-acetyltransferase YhbS